jgi:hypothetical protein
MPHFHFELHLTLTKFGEQTVFMTKQVMDIYMPILPEVAYNMAKSYLQRGWTIERMETRNFVFYSNIDQTWE